MGQSTSEIKYKSMFIYNMIKNTELEKPTNKEAYKVAVVGDDDASEELYDLMNSSYGGKEIDGRKLVFVHYSSVDQYEESDMMVVGKGFEKEAEELIDKSEKAHTLIVTDNAEGLNFCINFLIKDEKLRFSVNQTESKEREIKIGPALIKMATEVY